MAYYNWLNYFFASYILASSLVAFFCRMSCKNAIKLTHLYMAYYNWLNYFFASYTLASSLVAFFCQMSCKNAIKLTHLYILLQQTQYYILKILVFHYLLFSLSLSHLFFLPLIDVFLSLFLYSSQLNISPSLSLSQPRITQPTNHHKPTKSSI